MYFVNAVSRNFFALSIFSLSVSAALEYSRQTTRTLGGAISNVNASYNGNK